MRPNSPLNLPPTHINLNHLTSNNTPSRPQRRLTRIRNQRTNRRTSLNQHAYPRRRHLVPNPTQRRNQLHHTGIRLRAIRFMRLIMPSNRLHHTRGNPLHPQRFHQHLDMSQRPIRDHPHLFTQLGRRYPIQLRDNQRPPPNMIGPIREARYMGSQPCQPNRTLDQRHGRYRCIPQQRTHLLGIGDHRAGSTHKSDGMPRILRSPPKYPRTIMEWCNREDSN